MSRNFPTAVCDQIKASLEQTHSVAKRFRDRPGPRCGKGYAERYVEAAYWRSAFCGHYRRWERRLLEGLAALRWRGNARRAQSPRSKEFREHFSR